MPQFSYSAITDRGRTVHGVMDAPDERTVVQHLRGKHWVVTHIRPVRQTRRTWTMRFFGIPLKEKVFFAVNLSVMVGSGLPLSRALENLRVQTRTSAVRTIIADVHSRVLKGSSLADAMAQHPEMFDELFVSMVRVGEIGGNLDEALTIVSRQLEKEQQLRSRVRGAMMYPAIVLLAMVGVGILMLTYILPQIMGVFDGMDVELPKSTQVIVSISDFIRANGVVTALGAIATVIIIMMGLRTQGGARFLSYIAVHAPIIKSMAVAVNCARFARIHSSLLRSGVSVINSLHIVQDTLGNVLYKDALAEAIRVVERGGSLAETLRKYPHLFPVLVPQMIDVGEETGKTDTMLLKIAGFYEAYVDQMTKNMSSIIEPLLMLLIGGGVGFFAVAMLKPMYSVMQNIQ